MDARNRFREGYIMLTRPFNFAELKNPLQKMTILWAYSETPIVKNHLTNDAEKIIDRINNERKFFLSEDAKEEWLSWELDKVFGDKKNYVPIYEGEIVQCHIEGQMARFYPDEYTIMSREKIQNIMAEEGYHCIISPELKNTKEFCDKTHYLQSRGVSKRIAEKWASVTYGPSVIYKPYFQLLECFCRDHEIYEDDFYKEVEGITFKKKKQK